MGEVYRARDTRLGRDVALKVVSAAVAGAPQALARFEREARAVAALSHSNILAIHDVGQHSGTAYVVTELLDGETLRARLAGSRLALHKVMDYAVQMARGLAAAHDKGIVHRDLKPENVFVTSDGQVKLLDFGLARQLPARAADSNSASPTLAQNTEPGRVLGTPAYMAPEQARGEAADARTDIFALGAVLHEMLTGRPAFARQSAAETMAAILKEDPPDLAQAAPDAPPELHRIVRHCLEKNPGERFRSAHDLAFDLASLSGAPSGPTLTPASARPGRRGWRAAAATLAAAALAAGGLGYWAAVVTQRATPPSFQRLTFRRGHVTSARFTPDGHTIVYGAMWEGGPTQLFSTRLGNPESSALDLPPADILSVSQTGELAVSLGRRHVHAFMTSGRLARVGLGGGAPRELVDGVLEAEWASDGERLLVVRDVDGTRRLEFPAGRVLYETPAWIGDAHLSPRGDLVAFADHPYPGADNGSVAVIPTTGARAKKTLTRDYSTLQGLAWAPRGREIWFTGTEAGFFSTLQAVTPSGAQRLVARVPGRLRLHDIDRDGRVLLAVENIRVGAVYARGDEERDLSWLDASFATQLAPDGKALLLSEQGEGGGSHYSVYLRGIQGSPAVRLGEGFGGTFSPDGRWVATILLGDPPRLALLPTGPGESRTLPATGIVYRFPGWFPDGRRLVFGGIQSGHRMRLYEQELSGQAPRPITPEGFGDMDPSPVSPDSRWAGTLGPGGRAFLVPLGGGEPVPLPELQPGDRPIRFSPDGQALYCSQSGSVSVDFVRFDLRRRIRQVVRTVRPADPTGIVALFPTDVSPSTGAYVYSYIRTLSDLFLVEGLR